MFTSVRSFYYNFIIRKDTFFNNLYIYRSRRLPEEIWFYVIKRFSIFYFFQMKLVHGYYLRVGKWSPLHCIYHFVVLKWRDIKPLFHGVTLSGMNWFDIKWYSWAYGGKESSKTFHDFDLEWSAMSNFIILDLMEWNDQSKIYHVSWSNGARLIKLCIQKKKESCYTFESWGAKFLWICEHSKHFVLEVFRSDKLQMRVCGKAF